MSYPVNGKNLPGVNGVEGTVASGHINMTGTTPSFYPFKLPDYIISAIGWGNCEE